MQKEKIVILGGEGTIGKILEKGLAPHYEIIIADKKDNGLEKKDNYLNIDITDFDQLKNKIPDKTCAIINLVSLDPKEPIVSDIDAKKMCDVYVLGSYNVFLVARELGIKKVVFASTNHVTGHYEIKGFSESGRPITDLDYPYSSDVYGAMKLSAEMFGFVFSKKEKIKIICLRIGSVPDGDEKEFLKDPKNGRAKRTLLSKVDTVNLFKCALESDKEYGVYYGVSDNYDRPWDIGKAKKDIGYNPNVNAEEILKKES